MRKTLSEQLLHVEYEYVEPDPFNDPDEYLKAMRASRQEPPRWWWNAVKGADEDNNTPEPL